VEPTNGPACEDSERYDCNGSVTRIRDQDDCAMFYNCDKNIQHPCPSHCPDGLVFDETIEVCNWPSAVPECNVAPQLTEATTQGPACKDSERFDCNGVEHPIRDENNCTIFYNCDAQIQHPCPSHCPDPLVFDADHYYCTYISDVPECNGGITPSPTDYPPTNPPCAKTYNCNGVTKPVRDPNDCTKFYNCDINIQVVCPSNCPAGLVFDETIGVCNWPSAVPECNDATFDVEPTNGPACEDGERYDCNGSVTKIRDEDDCATFYNCDKNIQHPCPSVCPTGLVFDPTIQVCNWPADVVMDDCILL